MTVAGLSCLKKPDLRSAAHVASASQIKTWLQCNRKWWFGKGPLHLPELDRGYFTFGTVLHAVLERWLGADDLGNDPKTGQPVDLYPQGWNETLSRDKDTMVSVSVEEEDVIKKLVTLAIEEGILVRTPGRCMEQEFYLPVLETEDGGIIWIMGYIDLLLADEVQDHKSTKSMRWAASPKKLKVDPQMLIYAMVIIQRCGETGAPMPEKIVVRHNTFCKDPADARVRKIVAEVTPDEVLTFLEEAQRICGRMVKQLTIEDWHNVPDANETNPNENGCNAYGGCPFLTVCSGQENPKMYRQRVERVQATRLQSSTGSETVTSTLKESNEVNLFEKKLAERKAAKAAATGGSAPPATTGDPQADGSTVPSAAETPPAVETTPQATNDESPPWALADCKACKGVGFNTAGNPCRICNSKQTKAGGITSNMFIIEGAGDGTFVWEVLPEHADKVNAASGTGALPGATEPSAEAKEEKTETPAEPDPAPAEEEEDDLKPGETIVAWTYRGNTVLGVFKKYVKGGIQAVRDGSSQTSKINEGDYRLATPEEIDPPVETPQETPESGDLSEVISPTKGRGRPAKSFTLLINCAPIKGGNKNVIVLDEVMHRYGEKLAAQQGVDSFFMLDDFKRRNALGHVAPSMAEELGTNLVVVRGHSPDIRALCDALRPLAMLVIEGLI
ncbi:MAG: PD-(D/E)XK nuclease family protein [bacterium]|nr:PD-(D/E)XK nuclease family protein [bacterium]